MEFSAGSRRRRTASTLSNINGGRTLWLIVILVFLIFPMQLIFWAVFSEHQHQRHGHNNHLGKFTFSSKLSSIEQELASFVLPTYSNGTSVSRKSYRQPDSVEMKKSTKQVSAQASQKKPSSTTLWIPRQERTPLQAQVSSLTSTSPLSHEELQMMVKRYILRQQRGVRMARAPGLLIHIGKTAGSSVSRQLRNGCHSFVPRPCRPEFTYQNQSHISATSLYMHVPDFPQLLFNASKDYSQREFYVWTIRDPLARFRSAFVYSHPSNQLMGKNYAKAVWDAYACFPTLDSFAESLIMAEETVSSSASQSNPMQRCQMTALIMSNASTVSDELVHFRYSYSTIWEHIQNRDTATMLMLRSEFLQQDWISANEYLGQTIPLSSFERKVFDHGPRERSISNPITLPVPNELRSEKGTIALCHALRIEYHVYLLLLQRAVNLSEPEKEASFQLARQSCPHLHLEWPTSM